MNKVATHDFGASYQEGIVSDVDATKHRVRCKIPALEDLETDWLAVVTPNSGGNKFYCLPDEGELVALLLDARGEGGCVIGAIYNDEDKPPAADKNIWKKVFTNGTTIEHDRNSGDITIHASGKVIVNGSDIDVNGGTITVQGGDVIADGISLKNHVHGGVSSGGSTTGKPS